MAGLAGEAASVLRHLATAVDADRGAHYYANRGDGVLELVASIGAEEAARAELEADADRRPRAGWLRTVLPGRGSEDGAVARLMVPNDQGGLLVLERARSEPFSDADLALARVQARQLADEVTTRLGQRPIAWSAQLQAVQSVAAQLTRLTSVEEVSAALCFQMQRVVTFDNARVYVLREDGRTLFPVAFRPHAPEYRGESVDDLTVKVGQGITGWVAATGQPLIVHDAAHDPRAINVPGSMDIVEESMLLAPLRSEASVIGVVVLSRLGLHRFSEDDLRLLSVLADQAAVAIENARLLTQRERHVAELAALLEISQAGGSSTDERAIADELAGKLAAASHMETCLISRWDSDGAGLVPIGAFGRSLEGPVRDLAVHRATRHALLGDSAVLIDPLIGDVEPVEQARLDSMAAASALLLPLSTHGRVVGLVEFTSTTGGRPLRDGDTALLRAMTNQAAATLENVRLLRQLRDAAETDLVTGVYSHRHLQDRLRQEMSRAARSKSPLSVLMADLDDFKRINDEHGHQAGDRVLRSIASALRGSVRAGDVVARYGGDEFVILMPETNGGEARHVAERAAAAVSALAHPMSDGTDVHVSFSAGLALYPRDGRTGRELLRAADTAMYAQKRARARRLRSGGPPTVPPVRPSEKGPRVPA